MSAQRSSDIMSKCQRSAHRAPKSAVDGRPPVGTAVDRNRTASQIVGSAAPEATRRPRHGIAAAAPRLSARGAAPSDASLPGPDSTDADQDSGARPEAASTPVAHTPLEPDPRRERRRCSPRSKRPKTAARGPSRLDWRASNSCKSSESRHSTQTDAASTIRRNAVITAATADEARPAGSSAEPDQLNDASGRLDVPLTSCILSPRTPGCVRCSPGRHRCRAQRPTSAEGPLSIGWSR